MDDGVAKLRDQIDDLDRRGVVVEAVLVEVDEFAARLDHQKSSSMKISAKMASIRMIEKMA